MSTLLTKINVNEESFLTPFAPEDRDALVEHLNEKEIYNNTELIPFPYRLKDADDYIGRKVKETIETGHPVNWAIRNLNGDLIGSIGYSNIQIGKSHSAELGYWLAKSYWGKGIMSAAVKCVCAVGLGEFNLVRISAPVFNYNSGSSRVLEKCGFELEGLLRKFTRKDGQFIDVKIYALIK